jgi:hypothetical protein
MITIEFYKKFVDFYQRIKKVAIGKFNFFIFRNIFQIFIQRLLVYLSHAQLLLF